MMTSRRRLLATTVAALLPVRGLAQETPPPLAVARFSAGDLADWERERFSGETIYLIEPFDGTMALHAKAVGTASGLYRERTIDLRATPIVTWRWALGQGKAGLDPRQKKGDDYPLRLYFVVKRGLFNLDTIAVQYVWSLSQPAGTFWPNPFAPSVMQIAIDDTTSPRQRMVQHSRNLRDDFQRLFGEIIDRIDVVAIMTDADNAGGISEGWYGDVSFQAA
nr:DUF3047 domain-containing protein [uncultured Dongia sp.]